MGTIIVVGLVLVGGYILYSSWDKETGEFNITKGLAALALLGATAWAWVSGLVDGFVS